MVGAPIFSPNIKKGIYETTEFLEKFLRNLLLDEKHELHNREMHVSGKFLLGHDEPINDPINDPIKLDDREQQIIELLREKSDLTRKEMSARSDLGHVIIIGTVLYRLTRRNR